MNQHPLSRSTARSAAIRRAWLPAAVLVVGLLAGCGGSSSGGAAASSGSSEPLVIGASLPLTGDFAQPGGEAKKGYEIWQSMVNDNGGLLGAQGPAEDHGRRQQPGQPWSPTTPS
jgi:branched-chain amino acid transport system substrate-binding protein